MSTAEDPQPGPTVIVGAGPAGLATAAALARRGIPYRLVERGPSHAHVWRNLYDSLRLHTGRHLSSLPGLAIGRDTPLFPSRTDFIAYLDRYRDAFEIEVESGTDVTGAIPPGGRGWRVLTSRGEIAASSLVVATGIVSFPLVPSFDGQASFRGRVMHSSAYQRPAGFEGRRVLVVGCGNSGGEIASELAGHGARVAISVRTGANVIPLTLLGIPTQYLAWAMRRWPKPARRAIVTVIRTIIDRRRGPPVIPRPPWGPLDRIPIIGFHLVDAIRAGSIRVMPGIREFTTDGVRFIDDEAEAFDDVILATGFRPALQPLDGLIRTDAAGFAVRSDRVTSADRPDLFFVGHNYDSTGGLYNIGVDAALVAERLAAA